MAFCVVTVSRAEIQNNSSKLKKFLVIFSKVHRMSRLHLKLITKNELIRYQTGLSRFQYAMIS